MTDAAEFAPSFTINSSQQPCRQRARMGTPYVKARGQIILSVGGRRDGQARMPSNESTASPGHADERVSRILRSPAHRGHTSDDRQGEPASDHRQLQPDRWSRPRQAAYLRGRHGGQREEQAGGQSAAWSAASAASLNPPMVKASRRRRSGPAGAGSAILWVGSLSRSVMSLTYLG